MQSLGSYLENLSIPSSAQRIRRRLTSQSDQAMEAIHWIWNEHPYEMLIFRLTYAVVKVLLTRPPLHQPTANRARVQPVFSMGIFKMLK